MKELKLRRKFGRKEQSIRYIYMGKDSSPHQHQSLQSRHDTAIVDSERKVGKGERIIWKSDGKGRLDAVEWCCWISLLS